MARPASRSRFARFFRTPSRVENHLPAGHLVPGSCGSVLRNFCCRMLYFRDLTGPRQAVHTDSTYGGVLAVFHRDSEKRSLGYLDWLIDPSIRQNEAKQKAKSELERKLKASQALSVERERDGIKITNNTDQVARVQVAFIRRANHSVYNCYPGQSATFPPAPSDEGMNLPPREARLFLFSEAHANTGSSRECGFDDYAAWGWDEKSVPIFLSQKAHLF